MFLLIHRRVASFHISAVQGPTTTYTDQTVVTVFQSARARDEDTSGFATHQSQGINYQSPLVRAGQELRPPG
jgi:hypothetical protein